MEIAALTAFLAPFVKYLIKAGEPIAEDAAREINDKGWKYAKALWSKLWPRLADEPAARGAVADLAEEPDDEDRRAAMRVQLTKLLSNDPALGEELARIWKEAEAEGTVVSVVGNRSIGIGGSVSGSTLITGDENTVGGGGDATSDK
jgi:hypothetical protein